MPETLSHARAKVLRREMTVPEARLWNRLRGCRLGGVKFRRQHPIGPYSLPFFCSAAKLAIEVDRALRDTEDRIAHDRQRTAWLATQGIRVIRLRATDVHEEIDGVTRFILACVRERTADGYHPVTPF